MLTTPYLRDPQLRITDERFKRRWPYAPGTVWVRNKDRCEFVLEQGSTEALRFVGVEGIFDPSYFTPKPI